MTVEIAVKMVNETCITCGITFAVPETYQRWLIEKHKTFYCPNGHDMYYPSETEAEKLRRKLRAQEKRTEELEAENWHLTKQRDGTLDRLAKLKKRVNAGVCPYCRRHFANVERHINCKHKEKVTLNA